MDGQMQTRSERGGREEGREGGGRDEGRGTREEGGREEGGRREEGGGRREGGSLIMKNFMYMYIHNSH